MVESEPVAIMAQAIFTQAVQVFSLIFLYFLRTMEVFEVVVEKAVVILLMQARAAPSLRGNLVVGAGLSDATPRDEYKGLMVLKIGVKALNVWSMFSGTYISGVHQGIHGLHAPTDEKTLMLTKLNRCRAYLHHFAPGLYHELDSLLHAALLQVADASKASAGANMVSSFIQTEDEGTVNDGQSDGLAASLGGPEKVDGCWDKVGCRVSC